MADFTANLVVKDTEEILQAYRDALEPESGEQTARASYTLDLKKDLVIKVKAIDATAFRAITTTIVGLMAVVATSVKAANN